MTPDKFSKMELVILNGPQSGARIQFEKNGSLSIGGDINNDVILRDAAISVHQVKLGMLDNDVVLQVISGSAGLIGMQIQEGEEIVLAPYTPVQLGDTVFAYGESGYMEWEKVPTEIPASDPSMVTNQATAGRVMIADIVPEVASENVKKQGKTPLKLLRLALSGHIMFIVIGILVVYYQPQDAEGSTTVETIDTEIQQLTDFLQQEEYAGIKYSGQLHNNLAIQGYLAKKADDVRLDNYISSLGLVADNNIEVGEELSDMVGEIYRLNQIDADVELIKQGTVTVKTSVADVVALNAVEQIAYRDIPQLKTLNAENKPVLAVDVEKEVIEKKPVPKLKSAKIVMLAPGPRAYLMMSDHSKHYVGAMLPSGHKIARISIDKVYLMKAGKRTIVKF